MQTTAWVLTLAAMMATGAARSDPMADLRAADDTHRRAVLTGDSKTLATVLHPALIVNGATGRLRNHDELIGDVASGSLAHSRFDRNVERAAITGDVGVVVGTETVVPQATSRQAGIYGVRPLIRRFSNIYLLSEGRWRMIARHAGYTAETLAAQPTATVKP